MTDHQVQFLLMCAQCPDETSAILSLGATLGAVYIGATIAAVFYGITILQTVIYYKQNHNDPWLFRYAVAFLWILDTLQVALSTHALYFYLIKSFGKYLALLRTIWSFPLQFLANMLIVCGVQALYAVRIWKLGRHFHMILPWFIFLTVAATFGTGLYVIYDTYTLETFFTLEILTIKTSIYAVFSTMAGADFVIAGAMCFYLYKGRSMTSFSSTIKMIKGLMRLVVISGILTSACSLLTLVAYIAWPDTFAFVAIDLVLPKLYINSLLAMLNSRQSSMRLGMNGRRVHQKMIEFVHVTESRVVDIEQTNITIPGLSVTGSETNNSIPLSVTDESRSNGSTNDMISS
ncbi:hypothetical protein DFS33DRAFT_971340 [Desarmillaria ectypa]|nr:hypothetical protein DFS33DRAFT_971340 [Desarmillaria ectypa]